jgi:Sulfotransferase family
MDQEIAPLIIGATGGSGTRVVARLTRHVGYDLGRHLNDADDALAFHTFHDRWINRFMAAQDRSATGSIRFGQSLPVLLAAATVAGGDRGKHIPLSQKEAAQMAADFQEAVDQHIARSATKKGMRWGWKAPRSIYLLPFLYAQYPGLKFIHVLRDGRDMAFSKNQNQLRKHGPKVLSWHERWFNAEPIRSILLWARVNIGAAEFGENRLSEAYLAVRFEDLCAKPAETTARIMRFLGDDLDAALIARAEIAPPRSMGRWRRQPPAVVSKLEQVAQTALRKFGYLD